MTILNIILIVAGIFLTIMVSLIIYDMIDDL
jgi:hypothetical protein